MKKRNIWRVIVIIIIVIVVAIIVGLVLNYNPIINSNPSCLNSCIQNGYNTGNCENWAGTKAPENSCNSGETMISGTFSDCSPNSQQRQTEGGGVICCCK